MTTIKTIAYWATTALVGLEMTDRLVADNRAALSEQILNVAKAPVKPKVQPDGVSDDLGRETIATVRRHVILGCGHGHHGEHLSLIVAQLDNSPQRRILVIDDEHLAAARRQSGRPATLPS